MNAKPVVSLLAVLALAACQGREEPAAGSAESSAPAAPVADTAQPAAAPATSPAQEPAADAAPPAAVAPDPALAPAAPAASAPAAGTAAIAAQETNWPGISAEVLEFRRKGNNLTAKVRFRNQGAASSDAEVNYKEVYLMDLGAGKKYEVLKDEKGTYIAGLRSGWADRWYDQLEPGEAHTIWMKFPAPPAEVRAVTLQVPGVPPFEDLPIQDT